MEENLKSSGGVLPKWGTGGHAEALVPYCLHGVLGLLDLRGSGT